MSGTSSIIQSTENAGERYASALRECSSSRNLQLRKRLHKEFRSSHDHRRDKFLANLLIQMYGKCGCVHDASQVVGSMEEPNVFSWNLMITACIDNGHFDRALKIFRSIPSPPTPDIVACNAIIAMYAQIVDLEAAQNLFDSMPELSLSSWNSIIQAYASAGHLKKAESLFEMMEERNVFSWTALMTAYAQNGQTHKARETFEAMPQQSLVTWNAMLQAFAQNRELDEAEIVFSSMPEWSLVSWTTLLQAYAACGNLQKSKHVFDSMPPLDVVSTTALIQAYALNSELCLAAETFLDETIIPHKNIVSWTTLVVAYNQCGETKKAKHLFDEMPMHDTVVYSSMLQAFAHCGEMELAKSLFDTMPTKTTLAWTCMVAAYAQAEDLQGARQLFEKMEEHQDPVSWNVLIHAYGCNGRIEAAKQLFLRMQVPDRISWNTMMACYARSSCLGGVALQLHREMNLEGFKADELSLLAVIDGCNHVGMLQEGFVMFCGMRDDHEIVAGKEHYCTMIDLLCRCGQLESAEDLINNMPFMPNVVAWGALLRASRIYPCDLERAITAARSYSQLDQGSGFPFVLLSNIIYGAKVGEIQNIDLNINPRI